MARNKNLVIFLFLALLVFMNSCRERTFEASFRTMFVPKDSLTEYSLDIYARAVKSELTDKKTDIPIEIVLTSPSGTTYTDVRNLVFDKAESRQVGGWIDFTWRYRKEVQFPENGEWQFSVNCKSRTVVLRDAGIVVK